MTFWRRRSDTANHVPDEKPAASAAGQANRRPAHPPQTSSGGGVLHEEVGYNPQRDEYLYWQTSEGYIIAQDILSQYEYVNGTFCPHCGEATLAVAANLNRSGQGLSEMVTLCRTCRGRTTFIFDISNAVYQTWWAQQLGDLYVRQYEGAPRQPDQPPPGYEDVE